MEVEKTTTLAILLSMQVSEFVAGPVAESDRGRSLRRMGERQAGDDDEQVALYGGGSTAKEEQDTSADLVKASLVQSFDQNPADHTDDEEAEMSLE